MNRHPDKWVVLKINAEPPFYRVFAVWRGGYLSGESWRINSGVDRVEETEDAYLFYGHSGSVYECAKTGYGLTVYGASVIYGWLDVAEVMSEDTDWLKLI